MSLSRLSSMSRTRRGLAVVAPAVALTLVVAGAGQTAVAAPPAASHDGETAPTDPSSHKPPTAADLAAKQAEVAKLAAEVTDQQAAMNGARAQITELQGQLDAAQEKEAEAVAAQEAAELEQKAQTARLAAATSLVDTRRGEAGQWASKTYRDGNLGEVEKMMSLLGSQNTDDMAQRMQMLDLVGRWRGSEVDTVEEARAVQADATTRAQAAADAAVKAKSDAEAARASAEAALNAQTTQMMLIQTLLTQRQAEQAASQASAASMSAALTQQMMSTNQTTNDIVGAVDPGCPGANLSGYSNGQIPDTLLCPLYGTSGHKLRADAAKGFNDMSMAYAQQFGTPICVTDSYRSYAAQVAVKAAKPGLAATPGRSNHGWARATDLCGGIQSFGTPQHEWMRANAPQFGWCDPTWARAGGSKPEAWHWQYLNCSS